MGDSCRAFCALTVADTEVPTGDPGTPEVITALGGGAHASTGTCILATKVEIPASNPRGDAKQPVRHFLFLNQAVRSTKKCASRLGGDDDVPTV